MATNFGEQLLEHRLELVTLARDLNAEGRLSAADLARVIKAPMVRVHPLVFLAEQKLADTAAPGRTHDMDGLLAWLGDKSGQAVYQIDPLKINVTAVAGPQKIDHHGTVPT